jgi:hypothetical protein
MKDMNQNLAKEVRAGDSSNPLEYLMICSLVMTESYVSFQAGLDITHICLPPDSGEDEVMSA